MASVFANVSEAPVVEVFKLMKACREDQSPNKVDLGVGAYRSEEGKPWVLPVVKKAEQLIANDDSKIHEYLGPHGKPDFADAAVKLLLGQDSPAIKEKRAIGIQSLSGTGSLRVATQFLKNCGGFSSALIPKPTWGNHNYLLQDCGYETISTYRYWDSTNLCLDLEGMLQDIRNAKEGSLVILHACAHNPTGVDPTRDQWMKIAEAIQEKKHFPLFDSAYQGFASGDIDNDAWAVRYFVSKGFEMICCQSFAKNFGLYDERIGNITIVFKEPSPIRVCQDNFTRIIRGMYSNPPHHGARIVTLVLNDPQLFAEWKENISVMANRIKDMRAMLRSKLEELNTPGKWNHITDQIGMFSFTGLNPVQVEHMVADYHIYLLKSGRISMAGVNPSNVDYIANAIKDVISKYPK